MAAACGSWPTVPPSPRLAVWVGTPSKSPPIQTLVGRLQAITPVIDRAAHHSQGYTWRTPFVRARSLSLRVMIRQLIDVTVKAFHKVLVVKESIMASFNADYFSFSPVILSFYSSMIKVEVDNYWHWLQASTGAKFMELNKTLGLAFIWLWLCKHCSWQGGGGRKQTLLKFNPVT